MEVQSRPQDPHLPSEDGDVFFVGLRWFVKGVYFLLSTGKSMLNVSRRPFISLVCFFWLVGWLHPRRLTAKGPEKMMAGRPSFSFEMADFQGVTKRILLNSKYLLETDM